MTKEVVHLSEELDIPPPVLDKNNSIHVNDKKSLTSTFIRYFILIAISLAFLLFIFILWLNAMWDSAFSSGCWGFPGEDCS